MTERKGEKGEIDETSNTVYIDTNLDTRFIIPVSDSDTVLHLKEKIINEHSESFPELGKIKIKALKRKCKGLFYHMSNSMLVKNAFKGSTKCWFLSVDAFSVKQPDENQIPCRPVASNQQALIQFTKTNSGDGSNHQAINSSNKIYDHCGPGNSCNEVQKDLDVEVKNVAADNCSQVCSVFNGEVDCKSKTQEQLSERHVVLGTNTEHKEGDSRLGVNDHCDNTPEGSIRNESDVNKKLKSKKKDKSAVLVFSQKGENVNIDEPSSGKTVAKSPKDIEMKNVDDCKSRAKTHDSVLNCTLQNDGLNIDKHVSLDTIEKVSTDVEMVKANAVNAPIEYASNSIPASKKRKGNKRKQADNPQEDNNGVPMRNSIVPKSSVFVEENNIAASTEKLITEMSKDVDLVADASNKKNRKKKKRSSKNEEVVVELPSSHSAREERFKEEVETLAMNVDKEKAENIAKDTDVQLAVSYSIPGVEAMEHDVEPVEVKSVASELGPENGSKRSKKSKKHKFSNLNEIPPQVLNELGNVKESVVLSVDEDLVRDNDDIKISGSDKLKEQKELPLICSTKKMGLENCEQTVQGELDGQPKLAVSSANLIETNINMEAGNTAGSKRLKKKAKKPVSTVAVSSSNYSASEISTVAPHHLKKPTQLDSLLVKANDVSDNIYGKGEEENPETEEFVQKNYGKEDMNSRAKEKETKKDLAQEKITPKSKGVSAGKPRKKLGRLGKESQEIEVNAQQINYEKEAEWDSLVKVKENEMDISQDNVTEITPKGTVEPVANVVEKIKNSDMAVKSKKSTRVSLENGSERQSHPKRFTDIELQAAKMLNFKASKELQKKVNMGNNHPRVSKSSCKKMGEVVNGLEKSLLATPVSIFRDQSSESSEISNSSTKAPSDYSSSSSDSEKEGADSARGVDYGRSKNEPKTPHSQRIDMDMILRRSSKYKQAKLSAVLPHPEDIESQTVDFVPDSQPNH